MSPARRAVAVLAVALPVFLAYLWWMWPRAPAAPTQGPADGVAPAAALPSRGGEAPGDPGDAAAPITRTVHDRARRDAVRRQIFLAWSRAASPTAEAPSAASPPDPLRAPMPTLDGGAVDPDYLRARIREDFLPMAQQCYAQWAERAPGAPGGRVVTDFVILGDEHVGGVVDEVSLEAGDRDAGPDAGVLGDGEFHTCLRESMMAMAFQPPPGRGRLRVRYPFRFEAEEDGAPDR